jgi:hypothetical protein
VHVFRINFPSADIPCKPSPNSPISSGGSPLTLQRRRTATAPTLALLGLIEPLSAPPPSINSESLSGIPSQCAPSDDAPLLQLKASHQFPGQVGSLQVLRYKESSYLLVSQPGGEYVALDSLGNRVEPFATEPAHLPGAENPYLKSLNEANSFTVCTLNPF